MQPVDFCWKIVQRGDRWARKGHTETRDRHLKGFTCFTVLDDAKAIYESHMLHGIGIFTYISLKFMVNVGKFSIRGVSGNEKYPLHHSGFDLNPFIFGHFKGPHNSISHKIYVVYLPT